MQQQLAPNFFEKVLWPRPSWVVSGVMQNLETQRVFGQFA